MYLTVRETLELPALRELRLVAGNSGLDRRVTRVSVLEIPDGLGLWTSGGELFMSTFNSLRGDREGQIDVFHTLHENGIAALCLHPGLSEIEFLDVLGNEAEELGLPLLTMPRDMPYAVVADAVVGGLRGQQAALIQRSAAIHREFIQYTLEGQDLDALCRVVSRRTNRPVAVVGPDGWDVLADGGSVSGSSLQISELLRHRGVFGQSSDAVSVPIHLILDTGGPSYVLKVDIPTPGGPITQVAAPVVIGSEIAAYLVTWELGPPLNEFDLSVLAHACTAVGLVVLRRKAVMEAELQVQQDFYGAAVTGEFKTLDEARVRAEAANVKLASHYIVAVLSEQRLSSPSELSSIRHWPGSVTISIRNHRALLLHVPTFESQPEARAHDLLMIVAGRLSEGDHRTRVAQSQIVDSILDLPLALEQAMTALATAQKLNLDTLVVRFDELGVFQLLGQIGDHPSVRSFASAAIAQISAERGAPELLETLEAYLDAQGGHLKAAKMLSVHPNTVKYRISRARAILGEAVFQEPVRRLGLHLALKARRMLK
jgi:PucR family transcriptional regulator, purine catabolism regulatory protein